MKGTLANGNDSGSVEPKHCVIVHTGDNGRMGTILDKYNASTKKNVPLPMCFAKYDEKGVLRQVELNDDGSVAKVLGEITFGCNQLTSTRKSTGRKRMVSASTGSTAGGGAPTGGNNNANPGAAKGGNRGGGENAVGSANNANREGGGLAAAVGKAVVNSGGEGGTLGFNGGEIVEKYFAGIDPSNPEFDEMNEAALQKSTEEILAAETRFQNELVLMEKTRDEMYTSNAVKKIKHNHQAALAKKKEELQPVYEQKKRTETLIKAVKDNADEDADVNNNYLKHLEGELKKSNDKLNKHDEELKQEHCTTVWDAMKANMKLKEGETPIGAKEEFEQHMAKNHFNDDDVGVVVSGGSGENEDDEEEDDDSKPKANEENVGDDDNSIEPID